MIKINAGKPILAPMAGITGYPFRKIALKYGAGFCFTEMVSAIGFLHNDKASLELVEAGKDIEKTGIQLFGNSPGILAQAAEKAAGIGFKVVDINMGCPVKKVVKTGAGSAILKDTKEFSLIVKTVRRAIKDCIFTIKIRSGFDGSSINFMEIGKIAESFGVDAVFFHPRTKSLMFGGIADHSLTKKLKDAVAIPVYASGDIFTVDDAIRVKTLTGADGVMFARGAIGKPWIFTEYLDAGSPPAKKDLTDIRLKTGIIIELMEEMSLFYGEKRGHKLIRPHLYGFLRGFKGSKGKRSEVNNAQNGKELVNILKMVTDEVEFA
ncbi:MAG: tRNA-dihydrouridine synthase family protein [Deltaproteobacteria bacterium]|nr:tRNA-dihydrouridine synthase family protein [Deltaproteobacteria bacterium]